MSNEHLNLQKSSSSRIYGVTKTGANRTDQNLIKSLQAQGYNEHEIQQESGVHYLVVRSFMKKNNEDFMPTEAALTEENRHYIDRINALEVELAEKNSSAETEDEDEDEI